LHLQCCHFLKLFYLYRCICAKCEQMPTEPENVCCRKIPQVEFFVNGIVIMQSSSFIFHDTYTFNIQGNKKATAASKPTNMHAWLIIRALYLCARMCAHYRM